MPTVDKRCATRLRYLIAKIRHVPDRHSQRIVQRTVQPGAHTLRRYTLGELTVEAARSVSIGSLLAQQLVTAELERRGLTESADVVHHSKDIDDNVVEPVDHPSLDVMFDRITEHNVDGVLHSVGVAFDLMEPEYGLGQEPTLLSSQEQLTDLISVGAPQEMIDAYASTIEITDTSFAVTTDKTYDNDLSSELSHSMESTSGHEL